MKVWQNLFSEISDSPEQAGISPGPAEWLRICGNAWPEKLIYSSSSQYTVTHGALKPDTSMMESDTQTSFMFID